MARRNLVLAAFFVLLFAAPAGAECLSYAGRARVEGMLERKLFPGPPEYESIAAGDAPEIVWLIKLDAPVCVAADSTDRSGINAAVARASAIQLVLTDEQYKVYARWVGTHIVLTGKLFGAITAHHRTPVLMDMVEFSR
jgi:hypothetical protein